MSDRKCIICGETYWHNETHFCKSSVIFEREALHNSQVLNEQTFYRRLTKEDRQLLKDMGIGV